MTENNNEVNKNIDANIINESMHTVPEGGTLSSNGYIAPTIGRPNKSCWFMSHPTYEQRCRHGRTSKNRRSFRHLLSSASCFNL